MHSPVKRKRRKRKKRWSVLIEKNRNRYTLDRIENFSSIVVNGSRVWGLVTYVTKCNSYVFDTFPVLAGSLSDINPWRWMALVITESSRTTFYHVFSDNCSIQFPRCNFNMALKDLCMENRLTMHAYSAFRSNRREPVGWDAYSNIWGRSSIIEYINRHLWMKIKVSRYAGGWLSSPRYSRGTGGIIKSLTMPRLSLHPRTRLKKRYYEDSVADLGDDTRYSVKTSYRSKRWGNGVRKSCTPVQSYRFRSW